MRTDEPTGETVANQPRERFKNRSVAWRWVKDQLRGKAVALSQRKFYDDGVAGRFWSTLTRACHGHQWLSIC